MVQILYFAPKSDFPYLSAQVWEESNQYRTFLKIILYASLCTSIKTRDSICARKGTVFYVPSSQM